jgi:hypothetical protein
VSGGSWWQIGSEDVCLTLVGVVKEGAEKAKQDEDDNYGKTNGGQSVTKESSSDGVASAFTITGQIAFMKY